MIFFRKPVNTTSRASRNTETIAFIAYLWAFGCFERSLFNQETKLYTICCLRYFPATKNIAFSDGCCAFGSFLSSIVVLIPERIDR